MQLQRRCRTCGSPLCCGWSQDPLFGWITDRLEAAAYAGEVSAPSARDLRDALEFVSKLRIAHQARHIQVGQVPENDLSLRELSNFERSHLKKAFSLLQTLQGVLGKRYQSSRF